MAGVAGTGEVGASADVRGCWGRPLMVALRVQPAGAVAGSDQRIVERASA